MSGYGSHGLYDPDLPLAVSGLVSFEVRIFGFDPEPTKLEQIRHLLTGRPAEMVSGVIAGQKVAGGVQLFQAKGLDERLIQGIVDACNA